MTNKPELPDDRLDKIIAETSATIAERQAYSNTDGGSIEVNTALFLGAMRELRELRRSYLALRGEIEDVQAQLYEAENRNEVDSVELQERRKADNAEPVLYAMRGANLDTDAISTCKIVVDGWVDEWNQERKPGEPEYKTVPLYITPQLALNSGGSSND